MKRIPVIFACLFALSGCDSNNPVSSARSIGRLVVGIWVLPVSESAIQSGIVLDLDAWVHIIFNADGTFYAPWGVAGQMHEYKGEYWTRGPFIGVRGAGGPEGEARLHVQFGRLALTYWPDLEAIGLIITEIQPDYIATLGKGAPDDMSSDDIQNILKKLNDAPPPESALGEAKTYQKIERPPSF